VEPEPQPVGERVTSTEPARSVALRQPLFQPVGKIGYREMRPGDGLIAVEQVRTGLRQPCGQGRRVFDLEPLKAESPDPGTVRWREDGGKGPTRRSDCRSLPKWKAGSPPRTPHRHLPASLQATPGPAAHGSCAGPPRPGLRALGRNRPRAARAASRQHRGSSRGAGHRRRSCLRRRASVGERQARLRPVREPPEPHCGRPAVGSGRNRL